MGLRGLVSLKAARSSAASRPTTMRSSCWALHGVEICLTFDSTACLVPNQPPPTASSLPPPSTHRALPRPIDVQVSVCPGGLATGYTYFLPKEEVLESRIVMRGYMEAKVCVCGGGGACTIQLSICVLGAPDGNFYCRSCGCMEAKVGGGGLLLYMCSALHCNLLHCADLGGLGVSLGGAPERCMLHHQVIESAWRHSTNVAQM